MKPITLSTDMPITLSGAPASPYTRKMLAVLRYRRIPYRFVHTGVSDKQDWPRPKVALLPTFYLPDAAGQIQAVTDSSPIIRQLELIAPTRRVIPTDPVLSLLDQLLEDYGDEWLTKPMFHYRWQYADDIERSAMVLPHWRFPNQSDANIAQHGKTFADRQISRLGMVGSNETTGPVIEASYHRFLEKLAIHLTDSPFLFETGPGASDFAIFGQLTQLVQFDPTTMKVALQKTGRVYAWVSTVEDLTGLEPSEDDWINSQSVPNTLREILSEMGRTYVPVMLAKRISHSNQS